MFVSPGLQRLVDGLPLLQRLLAHVKQDPSTGCWLWTGALDGQGYGRIRLGRRYARAHRVCYELFNGPLPKALVVDHVCRVRSCINPSRKHTEPVTSRQNTLRGLASRKSAGVLPLFAEPEPDAGGWDLGDSIRAAAERNR